MSSIGNTPRVMNQLLQEVKAFEKAVATEGKLSSHQISRFMSRMETQMASLSRVQFTREAAAQFDKVGQAISKLIQTQQKNAPESVNIGNVLQSLWKEVKEVKREQAKTTKKKKVEQIEEIDFLNTTEEEFERFIEDLTKKKKSAKEELIESFMKELLKNLKKLQLLVEKRKKLNITQVADPEAALRIMRLIQKILEDPDLVHALTVTGNHKSSAIAHKRLMQVLQKFSAQMERLLYN